MRRIALLSILAASAFAQQSTGQWRRDHEAALKADGGWLTVTGLFWLKEGKNTVGSDPSSGVVLPRGPARAGAFELREGRVTYLQSAHPPIALQPDSEESIAQDQLSLFVIHRGDRYAIRLKDKQSKLRREFPGLRWYPLKDDYRVSAKFMRYDKPKLVAITNVLGQTEDLPSPGYAVFRLHGDEYHLEPVLEDNQLFFIFRDLTSGKDTYPAGRFLYAGLPAKDGQVVLDFNKAENPPCAFTPYATCPLPPPQNRLKVRIEAGELNYGHPQPAGTK